MKPNKVSSVRVYAPVKRCIQVRFVRWNPHTNKETVGYYKSPTDTSIFRVRAVLTQTEKQPEPVYGPWGIALDWYNLDLRS